MQGTAGGLLALDKAGVVAPLENAEDPELTISNVEAPLVRGIAGGLPDLDRALDRAGVLA